MKLPDFVQQQRKSNHLIQAALADLAGVGLRFVRELETNKPTLRMDKVTVILALFG